MLPLLRFSAVITALTLAACGGGGDDKPANRSSAASSSSMAASSIAISSAVTSSLTTSAVPSSMAPSSTALSSIAPSSTAVSSSSASTATVLVKINGTINGFTTDGDASTLDENQVQVTVHLLDKNEQVLASTTPIASDYSSSDELRFSADLSGAGATSIAVNVSAPGYTSFARKLDAENQINLDAKLQAIPVQTVVAGTATTASGLELSGFNIQVSADDDQQSNSLLINIPQSLLPDDTSSLDVAVRTFDPNSPEDAEFFPGAYADSDGNQLASVGFNFAEIKTNNNETLVTAMRKARQQKIAKAGGNQKAIAEEPVLINYQIPPQSCALLESLGDSAPNQSGFQIPVYTYNPASGLWDLIGQGTLYNEAAQQVPATQTVFNCATEIFTLEILVTNEIFQREWWNLDYPLAFNQPTDYCANIQLKNPDGQALTGINGFVMDNDDNFNFASSFFTTDSNGNASIRIAQSNMAPDLEAEVIFFDESEFGYVTHKVTLSTNCVNSPVQQLVLTRPQLCEVSGNFIYESGAPVNRNFVYGFTGQNSSIFGFDFTTSNTQGNYRLNLPCGGEYTILNFAALIAQPDEEPMQVTRIDGNLDSDELSDNGAQVVMKTEVIKHSQPVVTGMYDPATKALTLMAYSNFDTFPMSAQIKVKSLDGTTTIQSFSGNFTVDTSGDDEEMPFYFMGNLIRTIELPATDSGYSLEITFVDALGKTWTGVPGVVGVL
ncbi:hypothetical protein [Cellvibrio sp. UBA7671]|uniref:hypothetical protein n=1 Tax=Cellvibrio sp. UBA7671 TaxID=1946312 RepID=UPI002F35B4EE